MSAFNITLALPQARGADASSGKTVDPDGGSEADGNRFADLFRDLGRQATDTSRAADAGTPAAADAASTDTAQTLADALAAAGKSRANGAGGAAQEAGTTARDTAANLPAAAGGKGTRTGAALQAAATRQTLAAAAARLLSAADATKAQAAQDADDLAQAEAATDRLSTDKAGKDMLTADKSVSARGDVADAKSRRLQGNQGLNALLFGRTETEETFTALDSASALPARETEDTAGADLSRPNGATPAGVPDTATAGLAQAMALPMALGAALPTEAAQAAAGQSTAGRDTGATAAGTSEAAQAAQPMRITILSRETHFAPIRTLPLNGASASDTASATGAAATDGTTAPTFDLRSGAPDGAARLLAANASGTPATRAAIAGSSPRSTIASPASTVAADGETEANGVAPLTPPTVSRDTWRADARQAGRTASSAAPAGPTRSAATQATAGSDVTQERVADAGIARAEAEDAPLTGIAAIGGSSQPAAPAPALATLRQIGAAIAAEAGTMGASSSVAEPTANLIAGPVRLLDIQLSPDDLGTVNVRMRLSNNGLEIRLRASNAETAKMLERDQSALLDLLAASGITADSITIVGGDGAGLTQLTGQDAGRPFASPQPAAGEAETPREQSGREQQGRGSDDDRQKGQSRDDQARSPGRAPDLGGGFRV